MLLWNRLQLVCCLTTRCCHLGNLLSSWLDDKQDILSGRASMCGRVKMNDVLCYWLCYSVCHVVGRWRPYDVRLLSTWRQWRHASLSWRTQQSHGGAATHRVTLPRRRRRRKPSSSLPVSTSLLSNQFSSYCRRWGPGFSPPRVCTHSCRFGC